MGRAWRAVNAERYAENSRRWRDANRERIARVNREWRERNPEKMRSLVYAWVERNREHVNELSRRYYAERDPERAVTYSIQRRARVRGADGTHTTAEWREKVALFGGCCVYCGEAKPLTRDHKVPLVRGGTNDISNILPACGSCNSRKSRRTAEEFMRAS